MFDGVIAGSLPKPAWLAETQKLWPQWKVSGDELLQAKKDAATWGVLALERAAKGLTCTTAVHIYQGYGIKANLDWKETLGLEWRQYAAIFPAIAATSINQVEPGLLPLARQRLA